MRRPIRPQVDSWLRFGSSRRAEPATTNGQSGRSRAIGEHLAALGMSDV